MWYIVNTSDGKRYPISAEGLTIGRENCTILTPPLDARASREHATVRSNGESVEVQDLNSTNGTFINEQRIGTATQWSPGQVLRCGQVNFQLINEQAAVASAPANVTMAAPSAYMDNFVSPPPAFPQIAPESTNIERPVTAATQFSPQQPPPQHNSPLPQYSAPAANPYQNSPGAVQPTNAANNNVEIGGIVIGVVLLIIGLVGWQHYQPQMDAVNSLLGQLAIGFGGNSAASEVNTIKIYYFGSIILAVVGGIAILTSAVRLAVARQ